MFVLFIVSVISETIAFAFYVQGKETDDKIHILRNPSGAVLLQIFTSDWCFCAIPVII